MQGNKSNRERKAHHNSMRLAENRTNLRLKIDPKSRLFGSIYFSKFSKMPVKMSRTRPFSQICVQLFLPTFVLHAHIKFSVSKLAVSISCVRTHAFAPSIKVVFREPLMRRFHADCCSLAFCTYFILCMALVILPFIIAYSSHCKYFVFFMHDLFMVFHFCAL